MSSVCSSDRFILKAAPELGPNKYFYWDKNLKLINNATYSSITDFYELNTGSIIDVINSGNGAIYLVTKSGTSSIVQYTPMPSTSGDYHNTLLKATVTGTTLVFSMYSPVAKETTTYTYQMQAFDNASPANPITPCFNNYQIPEGTILLTFCDGFTKNTVAADSSGNAVLTQQANSTFCGYSAPPVPFRFSQEIEIEYKACILPNPIMLVWKNTLGGWDYWLFQKTQTKTITTDTLGSFATNYTRISDITNPETEIGKSSQGKIIVGAEQLTLQQKIGISKVLESNKVYILNQDGTINRQIKISPGSFLEEETEGQLHTIEFEILDVKRNLIQN